MEETNESTDDLIRNTMKWLVESKQECLDNPNDFYTMRVVVSKEQADQLDEIINRLWSQGFHVGQTIRFNGFEDGMDVLDKAEAKDAVFGVLGVSVEEQK